jgi:hypothetical protein
MNILTKRDAIVVNSVSFRTGTGIAPGSFASAFGTFPSGDLNLLVNGEVSKLAAATTSQLIFVIPADAAIGPAQLDVRKNGQSVSSGTFQITAAGPGLFVAAPVSEQPGAILNQDCTLKTSGAPAARGSVLQIFGTVTARWMCSAKLSRASGSRIFRPRSCIAVRRRACQGCGRSTYRFRTNPSSRGEVPVFVGALGMVSNGVTIWVQP